MEVNSTTVCLGIFGNPLGHSLSPLMHNAALKKMGLNYVYLPFMISHHEIHKAVEAMRILNIRGVNVTIPFKEQVMKYLDELDESARRCGAVNLIINEDGCLKGYNTDGAGFIKGLEQQGAKPGKKAVIIGAGGAARSITAALINAGAEHLNFLDLDYDKAENLSRISRKNASVVAEANVISDDIFALTAAEADIIINCTPVGMYPGIGNCPVKSLDMLKDEAVVCDVIYNPLETKLLALARDRGLKTVNGLPMFIWQGALSLEMMTGYKPPLEFMAEVVLHHLE